MDKNVITNGRKKAISKHAAVFSPMVFVKISMLIPRKKDVRSNPHLGIEKGSNRIK